MNSVDNKTVDRSSNVEVDFSSDHLGQSFYFKDDLIEDIFQSLDVAFLKDFRQALCQDNVKHNLCGLSLPSLDPTLKVSLSEVLVRL